MDESKNNRSICQLSTDRFWHVDFLDIFLFFFLGIIQLAFSKKPANFGPNVVHQFPWSRKNGKSHSKWGFVRVPIRTGLYWIIGIHVRGPIVGLDHFVHPKKWGAWW